MSKHTSGEWEAVKWATGWEILFTQILPMKTETI
jgi:hypothetical protein